MLFCLLHNLLNISRQSKSILTECLWYYIEDMSKVTIYTTPTCVFCKMAKAFFKNHDIPYVEKNVAVDEGARNEMIQKSEQLGVPVIDISGKIIVGFDEDALADALHIKK